jgi:hypothetical protein
MKELDGLKSMVQFYANHGALKQIEDKTGVPVNKIESWLDCAVCVEDMVFIRGGGPRAGEVCRIRERMNDLS